MDWKQYWERDLRQSANLGLIGTVLSLVALFGFHEAGFAALAAVGIMTYAGAVELSDWIQRQ